MKSLYLEYVVDKIGESIDKNNKEEFEIFQKEYCGHLETLRRENKGHHDPDLLQLRIAYVLLVQEAGKFYTKRKV